MNLVHYLYVFLWLSFSLLYHFATDDVKIHINNSGNKNLFLDASSHLYTRVCPSVGPSVRPHFRQNQGKSTFEQINVRAGILGSLDASLHLYKTFYQSIVWSVYQYFHHANINKNQRFSSKQESKRISCNHVIIQSFTQIWGCIVGLTGLLCI